MAKRWRGAEYPGEFPSLGWGLIDLAESYLRVPAGELAGQALKLTDEQVEFVVRLHRIDPVSGRYQFRRAVLRRSKGWGKSPIGGVLCLGHFVGPVVFDGWDANGEPVGRPHRSPLVQVAATAEDQTDNVWTPIRSMVEGSSIVDDFGLDVGLTRIYLRGNPAAAMEPVTTKAPSKEGEPTTFAIIDESHLLLPTNGGKRLVATIRRNVAKTNGLSVELTNAHVPGEESVAEKSFDAAERGEPGLLYDSREGPSVEDLADRPTLMAALRVAYGEAVAYIDLDRLADECVDPATEPADARRFYLNQLVAEAEDAVEIALWDAPGIARPDARLAAGDVVTVGFDGSDGGDSTALVALRASDRCLFVLGVWDRPEGAGGGWKVPRGEVHDRVAAAFADYRVVRMFCDPPYWQTDIDGWRAEYGDKVVERWATSSPPKITEASGRFDALLRAGELAHDGDGRLRAHVAAARRQRCRLGWRPVKKDTRKIDLFIAALGAVHAYGDALANGDLQPADEEAFAIVL